MSFFLKLSHEHLEKCSYEVLTRHYRYGDGQRDRGGGGKINS